MRMMRCPYCSVLQTERTGPQKCQCCGGPLEFYAAPPAAEIRAIADSRTENCVVHLLFRERAGTEKQYQFLVAVARGPSLHGEYPAAISAPIVYGVTDPKSIHGAKRHLSLLLKGLEAQGWKVVAPGKADTWWAYQLAKPMEAGYDSWEEIAIEAQSPRPTGRDLLLGLRVVFIANRVGRTEQIGALTQEAESDAFPLQALQSGKARRVYESFVGKLQRDGWQLVPGAPLDSQTWWKVRLRRPTRALLGIGGETGPAAGAAPALCSRCGARVADQSRFCHRCGAVL